MGRGISTSKETPRHVPTCAPSLPFRFPPSFRWKAVLLCSTLSSPPGALFFSQAPSGAAMGSGRAFAWAALVVVTVADVASAMTPAPAPALDCTAAVLTLADCLSYVQAGGTATKPEGTCCSGLKKVVRSDLGCLCEGLQNSASLGLDLNMTKVLALPAACGISTAHIMSNCNITGLTSVAPASSPSQFFVNSPVGSPGGRAMVPAASQAKSGASSASLRLPSASRVLLGVAAAAVPCFS